MHGAQSRPSRRHPAALPAVLALAGALALSGASAPTPSAGPSAPTAHHVDCSARTAGDGSVAHPWNRLTAVDAHGAFAPGDSILLKRGTTCRGRLAPAGEGTSAHPIVIGAYGRGAKPTVAGGGTTNWTGAVQLTDQEHWTVQDLHVTNTSGGRSTPYYRSGVMLLNRTDRHLHGLVVRRMDVEQVTSNMAAVGAGPRSFGGISALTDPGVTGGYTGLVIQGNRVDHVGRTGVVVSNNAYPAGHDVRPRITGNHVSWTRGDGVLMLGAVGGRMDHNVSAYAADEWPCKECGPITRWTANAAIWTGSSDRVRIDHNEAYGTKRLGGDGEGFDVDSFATNTLVEDNYSHDNEGGGILFCGSTNAVARFNVFEDDLKSEIAFIGSARAQRTLIASNTFWLGRKAHAGVVRTFNGLFRTRIRFENNLVYSHGTGHWTWPSKPSTAGNTIIGRNGRGRPTDGTTRTAAPSLVAPGTGRVGIRTLGGYRLRSGATNRDGVRPSKGAAASTDFFGRSVRSGAQPRGAAG